MQAPRQSVLLSFVFAVIFSAALPVAAESDWDKSYPVSAHPSLLVTTGDASLDVHPCNDCHAVRIRVEWNDRHPIDYSLTEFQSGNHVTFEMKERSGFGFHIQIGNRHEPHVTVEAPADLDLEARTVDGAMKVSGIQGSLQVRTGDGAIDVGETSGTLRVATNDGSVHVHDVVGTLESRSSDGHVSIEGKFSAVQVHTSDGALDISFAVGSHLTESSRIEGSDGRVTVRMPRTMSADLDVQTSDGKIDCQLPVTMNGYNSSSGSPHSFHGRLNAGGTPLTIRTSDGNVTLAAL